MVVSRPLDEGVFARAFASCPKMLVNVNAAHHTRVKYAVRAVRPMLAAPSTLNAVILSVFPDPWKARMDKGNIPCTIVPAPMSWFMCAADDPDYMSQYVTTHNTLVVVDAVELLNMDVRHSAVARGFMRLCATARNLVIVRLVQAEQTDVIPDNILKALGGHGMVPHIFYIELGRASCADGRIGLCELFLFPARQVSVSTEKGLSSVPSSDCPAYSWELTTTKSRRSAPSPLSSRRSQVAGRMPREAALMPMRS
jgi:hypothetical protein